jgi:hypothetical protein
MVEQDAGLTLELRRDLDYNGVAEALTAALKQSGEAEKLGLDDPDKLRFTQQQPFVNTPKASPLRWRGFDTLQHVMAHPQAALDTLFYEVLDIPLLELEQLKTLKVCSPLTLDAISGTCCMWVQLGGTCACLMRCQVQHGLFPTLIILLCAGPLLWGQCRASQCARRAPA